MRIKICEVITSKFILHNFKLTTVQSMFQSVFHYPSNIIGNEVGRLCI